MAAIRLLGSVECKFGQPVNTLVGPHCCAKFGRNQPSSFDNMPVFLFYHFVIPPKRAYGGIWPPKCKMVMTRSTKGTSLHRNTSYDVKMVEIGQMVAEDIEIIRFFQNGSHLPSWICGMCNWTSNEEYLVVFIVLRNLVEIDWVVLVICKFSYFTILAWKCLFTPPKWGFGGIWPPKWELVTTRSTKGTSLHRNMWYDV